jgi:hypothetical protein
MMGSSYIGVEDFYIFWDDVVSTGKVTDVSMNLATAILWVQEEWATWIPNIVATSSSATLVITDQLAQTDTCSLHFGSTTCLIYSLNDMQNTTYLLQQIGRRRHMHSAQPHQSQAKDYVGAPSVLQLKRTHLTRSPFFRTA